MPPPGFDKCLLIIITDGEPTDLQHRTLERLLRYSMPPKMHCSFAECTDPRKWRGLTPGDRRPRAVGGVVTWTGQPEHKAAEGASGGGIRYFIPRFSNTNDYREFLAPVL